MATRPAPREVRKVPTYCYQCVAGPDFLTVKVVDGVATEVEPNFKVCKETPSNGKVCVKAYGLIQKLYNPNRILTPMRRTNPNKGRDQDPGFEPITWDEALDTIAERLHAIQAKGPTDASGYPRIAASFGGGGTPTYYMGTLPAFLASLGPIDFGFGSGQGVKCYHSEHLYGELWHRAFTVAPDTPHCDYVLSFGYNVEASGGVAGVARHADFRARRGKRVQIEPHQSVTAACSSEWVPIRPKTDPAFMFALIHVMLYQHGERLDIPFLKARTTSPYLVAPNGYFLRDPETRKPLIYDLNTGSAVPFDTPGADPALEGVVTVSGVEIGADEDIWEHESIDSRPSFQVLRDHIEQYTPEWAADVCGVDAAVIERLAGEFIDHARVGATVEIEGRTLPYRPVAVALGKTVNNGWGGFDCCWARTLMACLVGALEVPGGTLGTTVRLNRPATDRALSVKPHPDGYMDYPMNPTDKENWQAKPEVRNAHRTLVPLVANSPWSQALGPTHLAWMQQRKGPEQWPEATQPEIWFVYRTNPAVSFWDTDQITEAISHFPFTVCFAYTQDETNWMADILLPDRTDLEGLQLIRVGGTKFIEQFWDFQGFALRQPVAEAQGDARDFTWIATELARRSGILDKYNKAINRGAAGVPLKGEKYDFSLDENEAHDVEAIWDAACRAASAEITDGRETQGLDWYRENAVRLSDSARVKWYLYAALEDQGLRFELPYQERLLRTGRQLARRLHEQGIHWWDKQLDEYEPLPVWKDFPGLWERALEENYGVDIDDYPFWALTARSMQYMWGGNVSLQMIKEVSDNVAGHRALVLNTAKATEMGLKDGDVVEIRSPLNATEGPVLTRQGIRPDTVVMIGQFDQWATPYARDNRGPSLNSLVPMLLDLTDATGSGADVTKVAIKKLRSAR